jgi:hypothetical protein
MTETIKEIRKTITSIFFVPTLNIPREELRNNGFLNGYSKDGIKDVNYEDSIYLLFKPKQLDRFREFLDGEYERTKQILDDYDHRNGFVVVVYKLDMKYAKDFSLIRQGRYSHASPEFQKLFPEEVTILLNGIPHKEVSLQYRIFNKTKDLIDFWEEKFDLQFNEEQELWYKFKEEEEILTEEKLNEYVL